MFMMRLFLALFVAFASYIQALVIKEEFLTPERKKFDCHTTSIIETSPGKFLAVWKGGPGKGFCNHDMYKKVGVWMSLSDGKSWSKPEKIVRSPKSVCWNPVLCRLPSGEILLFYRQGETPRCSVSFVKRSFDEGKNWSEAEILPAGIVGPTKTKPIVLNDGTIISPSSSESGGPKDELKATALWIEISHDGGRSWEKYGPLEIPGRKFGGIEPVLFFDAENHLRLLCRDRAARMGVEGFIWSATSLDLGKTWTKLRPTLLPNPDSGIDAIDFGNGKIVLFYNHSHKNRYPLALAVSNDGGDSWSMPMILEKNSGEFPDAIISNDGFIHLTYPWAEKEGEQRRIKHVVLDPSHLSQN